VCGLYRVEKHAAAARHVLVGVDIGGAWMRPRRHISMCTCIHTHTYTGMRVERHVHLQRTAQRHRLPSLLGSPSHRHLPPGLYARAIHNHSLPLSLSLAVCVRTDGEEGVCVAVQVHTGHGCALLIRLQLYRIHHCMCRPIMCECRCIHVLLYVCVCVSVCVHIVFMCICL
jgi:hypothetical protein